MLSWTKLWSIHNAGSLFNVLCVPNADFWVLLSRNIVVQWLALGVGRGFSCFRVNHILWIISDFDENLLRCCIYNTFSWDFGVKGMICRVSHLDSTRTWPFDDANQSRRFSEFGSHILVKIEFWRWGGYRLSPCFWRRVSLIRWSSIDDICLSGDSTQTEAHTHLPMAHPSLSLFLVSTSLRIPRSLRRILAVAEYPPSKQYGYIAEQRSRIGCRKRVILQW